MCIRDRNITLYSSRAQAITNRIQNTDWDIAKVAQAAHTSNLTISQNYAQLWQEKFGDQYANTFAEDPNKVITPEEMEEVSRLYEGHLDALKKEAT